jgi:putative hydrolase of the HAD superfamily
MVDFRRGAGFQPASLKEGIMDVPRAILFDLGGTLLRQSSFDPGAWSAEVARLAPDAGLPGDEVRRLAHDLVSEFRRHGKAGLVELRIESCLRHLHDRLGLSLPLTPAEVSLAFWRATSSMEPEPGVGAALRRLAARGIPLGVVSNSMFGAEVLRWELARHGLDRAFSLLLSSADYGLRKPHPSLFRTAVACLKLAPGEVWFVGDNFARDVAGAAGAGLRPVWYNPEARDPPTAPAFTAVAQFTHWDEFPGLLAPP